MTLTKRIALKVIALALALGSFEVAAFTSAKADVLLTSVHCEVSGCLVRK